MVLFPSTHKERKGIKCSDFTVKYESNINQHSKDKEKCGKIRKKESEFIDEILKVSTAN